jgi:hypothetical protein
MFNKSKQPIQFQNFPKDSPYHQGGWQLREGRYDLTAFPYVSIWFLYWDSISIPQMSLAVGRYCIALKLWFSSVLVVQFDVFILISFSILVLGLHVHFHATYYKVFYYLPLTELISGADVVKLTPTGPDTKNNCWQGSVSIYPTNWLNLSSNWG